MSSDKVVDRLVLENQKVIMDALAMLIDPLHVQGIRSRALYQQIKKTENALALEKYIRENHNDRN